MQTIPFQKVIIDDAFWSARQQLNSETALNHQWEQLEKSGCINNFRILADQTPGIRRGWFFADSDAYKWLDAAARVYHQQPTAALKQRMDIFIDTLARAQAQDGYLYTYNQIHFPDSRWQNLKIEHELYCHGHLIEAAVSHYEATGDESLLNIGRKAADLLVRTFHNCGPEATPGHQEIEIALMRLYDVTEECDYLELAEQFILQRGQANIGKFAWQVLFENMRVNRRTKQRDAMVKLIEQSNPQLAGKHSLPAENYSDKPPFINARFMASALDGKYFQQNVPVHQTHQAVGHAVRFAYLETAIAMLIQRCGDQQLLINLASTWQQMVEKRLYVTGGTGSLPVTEGFGRDYELDPNFAYAETCAALGTMFWNWEMTRLTCEASYADLFERQLYNASLVGIGQTGDSYLYNNPLANRNGLQRQSWFQIPCCPSNISRTWASLGKYIYSHDEQTVWIHQYIGSRTSINLDFPLELVMHSAFPWEGQVKIQIDPQEAMDFTMVLRIPSWAVNPTLSLNGESLDVCLAAALQFPPTGSGYDPRDSQYLPIRRVWQPGDVLELNMEMPIKLQYTHPKVKSCRGKVAVTCGPLVYCLEAADNPGIDLFNIRLDPDSLEPVFREDLFGGINSIKAKSSSGEQLTFIPYAWWANRDPGQMTVYVGLA